MIVAATAGQLLAKALAVAFLTIGAGFVTDANAEAASASGANRTICAVFTHAAVELACFGTAGTDKG